MGPLATAQQVSLSACGFEFKIPSQNVQALRDFAGLFPMPAAMACVGGRLKKRCVREECSLSPVEREALVRKGMEALNGAIDILPQSARDVVETAFINRIKVVADEVALMNSLMHTFSDAELKALNLPRVQAFEAGTKWCCEDQGVVGAAIDAAKPYLRSQ